MIEKSALEENKLSYTYPGHKINGILLKYLHNKPGRGKLIKGLIRIFPKLNKAKLIIGQAQLKLDLRNDTDVGYFYGNGISHERFYRTLLMTLVGPETVFYDIGSNIGYYSFLLASQVHQVYSFEPNPVLSRRIDAVIKSNSIQNISLFNIGLGNQNAVIPFYVNPTLHDQGSFVSSNKQKKQLQIQIKTLDSIIRDNKLMFPDIIKIDTEGFDLDILAGYSELTIHKPIIFMEWIEHGENESKMFQRLIQLIGNQYLIYRIDTAHQLIPFEVGQSATSNLLLMPIGNAKIKNIENWIA